MSTRNHSNVVLTAFTGLAWLAGSFLAPSAHAQSAVDAPLAASPKAAAAPPTAELKPNPTGAPSSTLSPPPPKAAPLLEAMKPSASGLTLEQTAQLAVIHAPNTKIKQAEIAIAKARLQQAFAAYFPSLRLSFSYNRLSPVENSFDVPEIPGFDTSAFSFPVLNDQLSLSASLEIPLSDYLLRLRQAVESVSLDVDAKKLEARATEQQSRAKGKAMYLDWARALGGRAVAKMAVAQAKAHLSDAKLALEAGVITKADFERLNAQQAQAEHMLNASDALVRTQEDRLRINLKLAPNKPLSLGSPIMTPHAPKPLLPLPALQKRAMTERLEIKALDKTIASLEQVVSATRASYVPRVAATGSTFYANPNPRHFPQADRWDLTWQLGVNVSWTVNDTFRTMPAVDERVQQVVVLKAQADNARRGIKTAVAAAYHQLNAASSARRAAKRQADAASITLEATRTMFRAGKSTAVSIVDAEATLTRARLQQLNAQIDRLSARVRLEQAIGGAL